MCEAELAEVTARNVLEKQRDYCDCPETQIDGTRFKLHRVPTDCEYVRKRNQLIEKASQIATKQVGEPPAIDNSDRSRRVTYANKWTAAYVSEMDRLAAGLLR